MGSLPYSHATGGSAARAEIVRLLKAFGCESVGLMDDFTDGSLLLAFRYRGRAVQLKASGKGWAAMYLKENPWSRARKSTQKEWENAALERGTKVTASMLRDWIKGQLTAVECGLMPFEHVFMPYMLTNDGRPLVERVKAENLLPPPEER